MESGVLGVHRFLNRAWSLADKAKREVEPNQKELKLMHQTIKKVDERIERMKFNTAVAALSEFINAIATKKNIPYTLVETFLILLSPFAPHLTSELWEKLGNESGLTYHPWPQFDPELAKETLITVPIQVNGKLRDTVEVEEGTSEQELFTLALSREKIIPYLKGKEPKRLINVKNKLVNIVV